MPAFLPHQKLQLLSGDLMREFKGVPRGKFRDDARWNDDRMTIEFTLDMRGEIGTAAGSVARARSL